MLKAIRLDDGKVQIVTDTDPARALKKAVDTEWTHEDPVAQWDGCDRLCAVDLDATGWDEPKLRILLDQFQPTPSLSWITKSGGLRLVYIGTDRLSAEEVAAVAYLCLSETVQYEALELKSETRLPVGDCFIREQSTDYGHLRRALRQYSVVDGAVKEWLESRGLQVGERYEHDRCPVDPTSTAHGKPVMVGETGIKCFVCDAHGTKKGSNKPGFFPFAAFVGGQSAELLYYCLDGKCHWEHAKHVMEDKFSIPDRVARVAYGAALKIHHQDMMDTERDRVLDSGRNLIRMDGRWTNCNGEPYVKDVRPILAALPASRNGKSKPSPALVSTLDQTFDLAEYGYPHLTPVFGLRVYSHFVKQCDTNRVRIVVQTPHLSRDNTAQFRPKYVLPDQRVNGWARLAEICPGIEPRYVKLLIVAKGFAEGGVGMPPMIFVTGSTSSAKTGTVIVAASIAGDGASEHMWTSNVDRVRQAVRDSKDSGSFAVFNEFMKEVERSKQSAMQAADFILNLTPSSTSWKIWTGPVRMGDLPVFVWTDTKVPTSLKQDAQLGRRLVHVHLPDTVDWRDTLWRSGVDKLERFRLHSRENADAADAIVSEVIDEFFQQPTTFEDSARQLGYLTMAESSEAHEGRDVLVAFFVTLCSSPDADGVDAKRWQGRGWKVINRNVETELSKAWDQVCDEDWRESRQCSSVDWRKLVNAKHPIKFESRSHGTSKIAVRFREANDKRQGYFVNQELLVEG